VLRSREIQGLRALAVSLVLLFHAGWLPGGYIGVDVFYVISGFLITSIIINDADFSFKKFYVRRAKRLLPAAFFVLAATAIAYWLIAPSGARAQFAKELLAGTWYLSNYFFAYWANDYQNLGAEPSPLVHFWSLAVEEQFYIFWPLLLMLFTRKRKQLVIIVTLASFFFSIYLISVAPIFAFYSLPTRAFELGLGALMALYGIRAKLVNLGIVTILASALIFDESTKFPGFPALLPILGAAMVIASINRSIEYRKFSVLAILNSKIAQTIGNWSYSIYLWHWPLLVIPPIYLKRDLGDKEKLFIIIFCIAIAAMTYKYVENPLRKMQSRDKPLLVGLVAAALLLSGTAFAFDKTATKSEYSLAKPIIYDNGCHQGYDGYDIKERCVFGDTQGNRSIALFGDSHAAQWFPALDIWAKRNKFKLYVYTKSSCPALSLALKDSGGFKAENCLKFKANALDEIAKIKPKLVVVGIFEHYKVGVSEYLRGENFSFDYLLIRDTPYPNRDIPICLTSDADCDTRIPDRIPYKAKNIFDPTPYLCTDKCPAVVDGLLAYRDRTHITVDMALHLEPRLSEKLDSLVAR
jgi:peptidoglycan/LPS O-acetylase OafA/YrhL